jgi:hypothetical protein
MLFQRVHAAKAVEALEALEALEVHKRRQIEVVHHDMI